jgi:hypothetical protein
VSLRLLAALALGVLGCVQMTGDVLGLRSLRAVGLASHASPAPKVFTAQEGYETFSPRFFVTATDAAGGKRMLEMTPATYARLEGPYNRRNAYGAALSYGPVLAANPRTRPMLDAVMQRAFCGPAPVLHELFADTALTARQVTVRAEPRSQETAGDSWQRRFAVICSGETR